MGVTKSRHGEAPQLSWSISINHSRGKIQIQEKISKELDRQTDRYGSYSGRARERVSPSFGRSSLSK